MKALPKHCLPHHAVLLLVRQIFRRDNAFYICAGMHFFYNLMVFFVISI